ncbi:Hypothetical predicted protein [Pelobates cultripes]|uniref:Uncharacterized protein n=1 Tax=Pelobates cultripes TaxID=61616 RepID=A0AAD1SDV8_PELCU|nr:Hypothetical predicted protein [Pelobates cultripes]
MSAPPVKHNPNRDSTKYAISRKQMWADLVKTGVSPDEIDGISTPAMFERWRNIVKRKVHAAYRDHSSDKVSLINLDEDISSGAATQTDIRDYFNSDQPKMPKKHVIPSTEKVKSIYPSEELWDIAAASFS